MQSQEEHEILKRQILETIVDDKIGFKVDQVLDDAQVINKV